MLGKKLGGRKEVMEMPAVELLGMMDLHFTEQEQETEKEKTKAFLQYLIASYTAPTFGKPDAGFEKDRKAFEDMLKPEHLKPKAITEGQPAIVYDWDEEVMKRYKTNLEGG